MFRDCALQYPHEMIFVIQKAVALKKWGSPLMPSDVVKLHFCCTITFDGSIKINQKFSGVGGWSTVSLFFVPS